jgi:1,2-diacylglycerol 3-alpha-glucosyltransferase
LHILMISDVYFPRVNGVSTSIKTFREELTRLGHKVTLVVPEYQPELDDDTDVDEEIENLVFIDYEDDFEKDIIRVPSRKIPLAPEDRMMKKSHIDRLAKQILFSKQVFSQQYDLVHIHTPFVAHFAGVRLAKRLGIPFIETYHTYFEEYLYHYLPLLPQAFMKSMVRWFTRIQCNKVNTLVAPSTAMLNVLKEYGVKVPINIIPTGVERDLFKKGQGKNFRQKYDIPADRPVIMHVGRVAHEKNIDLIFNALVEVKKSIPEILLIVAGEGPALNHLNQLGKDLQLQDNLLYVGYLQRNSNLRDCYCAADAVVFASPTETQGLALLEAMAHGVPVISTAMLGTKDVLDAGLGALIAEETIMDFATKTVQLLEDKDLHEQLSREAVSLAKSWSSSEMAQKMALLYRETIRVYSREQERLLDSQQLETSKQHAINSDAIL